MKRYAPLLVALALVAVFAYAAYETQTWSTRSRTFGIGLSFVGLGLAALALAREALRLRRPPDAARAPVHGMDVPIAAASAGWAAAFYASLWALGLLASVPLFSVAYLRLAAKASWPFAVGYAIVASIFVYAVFVSLLHIRLPTGILFGGGLAE
ncbi:MAG TPA: tripartite tricarboxylate transporter TctB family protein [Candidatus Limnocylindria bacterium]|nr:tripartite tricarboxylate transporter TctB family protein [Candidatus Limnocylindria bacterium]